MRCLIGKLEVGQSGHSVKTTFNRASIKSSESEWEEKEEEVVGEELKEEEEVVV